MENSNNLALIAEDLALMYKEDFSKKKAVQTGIDLVNQLFENGKIDPLKVWANIARLKEVVNSADKTFRDRININNKDSSNGVEFAYKNGSKKLNYSDDPIYSELAEKVKARAELLKLAESSKDTIYDIEGIEVPKVSCSYDKSSVTVTF